MTSPAPRVLYCRLPGLLALSLREARAAASSVPVIVTEGRVVRDACSLATRAGVRVGQSLATARRLCPLALYAPAEEVIVSPDLLLEPLAALSEAVEPLAPDTAFASVRFATREELAALREQLSRLTAPLPPVLGLGPSKVAARAAGECHLPSKQILSASVRWLCPEDKAIAPRLSHLGLATFGDVVRAGEAALLYAFGKRGRTLFERAGGVDRLPVRALYPPPRVEQQFDFAEEPVENRAQLDAALARLVRSAAKEMKATGLAARRVTLTVHTEQEVAALPWATPAPVHTEAGLLRAARHLLSRLRVTAPVTGLHLLLDSLESPTAVTASLFGDSEADKKARLKQTVSRLSLRFRPALVQPLAALPLPARDKRREALREGGRL